MLVHSLSVKVKSFHVSAPKVVLIFRLFSSVYDDLIAMMVCNHIILTPSVTVFFEVYECVDT